MASHLKLLLEEKEKRVFSTKYDYDLVTDRLNSAVRKCRSKEDADKFLEMFFLGTARLVKEKFNS